MLIFSHRGYHASAAANTYDAFAQAVALGVGGIETDVRLSADSLSCVMTASHRTGTQSKISLIVNYSHTFGMKRRCWSRRCGNGRTSGGTWRSKSRRRWSQLSRSSVAFRVPAVASSRPSGILW